MNYKIIQNYELLRDFINWLPNLKKNEMFYVALYARKKYDSTGIVRNDKQQLKRFTSNKEMLYAKIKQLECEEGGYVYYGSAIPQESLVLYISVNPRNLRLAAQKSINELSKSLYNYEREFNPHQVVLTQVQNAIGTEVYKEFDFDGVEWSDIQSDIFDIVNMESVNVVKTKNGFHLLIKFDKIETPYRKGWYDKITKLSGCDVTGDELLPVIGCTQGNFTPYLLSF